MENSGITRRGQKALETREKILTAAEQLFQQQGFKQVSVDAIVKKAGVAKGSFYVHFSSKNTLITSHIAALVHDADKSYGTYLETFPQDTPTAKQILSLSGKIADILSDRIGHERMEIVYETLLTKEVNVDSVIGYDRELYNIFNGLIERGVERGEFKTNKPAATIARHCVLSMRGLTYEWCIRYPDFNLKEAFLTHFEMLLDGITV